MNIKSSLIYCAVICFYFLLPQDCFGQTTWDGGGADDNWNTPNNWNPNGVPTVADDVVIPNGITGTITINTAAVCSSFTMSDGGTSTIVSINTGNSLTVSNEVSIGSMSTNFQEITLAVNDGTLSCSSLSVAAVGGFGRTSRVTASTGTINVTGDITIGGGGFFSTSAIQFTGAGALNIGGTMSGGAFTASTSTVEYYNANQTIGGYTYNNLILSGSGTKDLSDVSTINGNFTMNGTVTAEAGMSITVGGDFTISSGTTFTANTYTHNVVGDWLNNGGTLDLSGSTLNLNGTAQNIGGTSATAFDFLSLSGSGTKTFGFSTAINSNLSIADGVVADLGTFTGHTAEGLTLGGVAQVAGIWGHTNGTGVTQPNNTYFANNTGVITTSSAGANIYYSRQTGNWNAATTWSTITYGDMTNNGTFPVAGDIVNIGGGDYAITVNVASACETLAFEENVGNSPSIILSGTTLDVSGSLRIPRPAFGENHDLDVGSGTLNAGSIHFDGGGWLATTTLTISTGTVTVTGDVTSDGLVLSFPNITFTGAGVLQIGGAFLNSGNGNLTPSTGTVEYNGNSTQMIGDFTYNHLTLSGTGDKSTAGSIDVNGDFTLASGSSFTAGAYSHTIAGNWVNNGGTFNNSGSNINFDNAGAQNIGGSSATDFNRLSLSGSGIKSLSFSTSIAGNLSIDGTAQADLSTFTSHTANGLTLGGVSQVAGIWGHTNGIGVTQPNNIYFANNTGVITTASTGANIYFTRQTGNWNAATTWSTITYGDVTNNGTFPVAGDIVNIGGGDFTITVNVASACESIYFQSNNTNHILTINTGINLDVSEEIDIPSAPVLSGGSNTLAVGAGTLNANEITFTTIEFGGAATFTISTGTANVDGDITATGEGEGTFTFTDAGLLQLGGAIIGASNIDMTAGTGTVEYDGIAAQTIVNLDYYNLTLNNSLGAIPAFTLNGNTTVANTLTMTSGVVDMDSYSFTLGTSTAASTLIRTTSTTTNWFYNGIFNRFWQTATAVTSNSGNYYGLLPIGSSSSSSYRPVEVTSTVSPTGAGTFSVSHTDADTKTQLSPVYDDGGTDIEGKHDAPFNLSTSATGGTYDISITMTDLASGVLSDIRLAKSTGATTVVTVGTHAAATGSATNPTASRTSVALADLVGDWRMATTDIVATPLPVDLLSFTGDWQNDRITLQWQTASELNNDYFVLERSEEGLLYERIATISGNGNSNEIHDYNFNDRNYSMGMNYYQLKQVDFDGNSETFEPILIYATVAHQAQLNIYPNPATDHLNIRLEGVENESNSVITIYNHAGQIVYQNTRKTSKTNWTIEKISSILVPGIYMINVQSANLNLRKKLMIQM